MARENVVVNGATIECSAGSVSGILSVSGKKELAEGKDVGNSQDNIVGANIPTFGTCSITGNPCAPAIVAPWTGVCTKTKTDGQATLKESSTVACTVGGTISVSDAGQVKVLGE